MDISTIAKGLCALLAATFIAAGCDNPNAVLPHSASEQKAYDALKAMSPQQRIDMIEKGPMPAGAKEQMIKKIKADNGMQ